MDPEFEYDTYDAVAKWNPSYRVHVPSTYEDGVLPDMYWEMPSWKVDAEKWSFDSSAPRVAASTVKCVDCDEGAVEHITFECCGSVGCCGDGDYWFCQSHLDEWNGH